MSTDPVPALRNSSEHVFEELSPGPPNAVLIDTIDKCKAAVKRLLHSPVLAVDLEGIDLGRHPGKACIMQVCGAGADDVVYLFDLIVLQEAGFENGRLAELLEAPQVQKVFWDVRADCDALHHNHKVIVKNAYDLQVLYYLRFHPKSRGLPGLGKALAEYGKTEISAAELARLEQVKREGKLLFAPERGGSYDVWECRPLCEELVHYCAADVQYLLKMKEMWGSEQLDNMVDEITAMRIAEATDETAVTRDGSVDFSRHIPFDFTPTLLPPPHGEIQESVRVLFPGKPKRFARWPDMLRQIQTIASGCGASALRDKAAENPVDHRVLGINVVRVTGRQAQVEDAVHLIRTEFGADD